MRDALADRVGWSQSARKPVGRMLFADPVLFAIAGIQTDGSGQYGAAETTPSALALLVIATLIEQPTSMLLAQRRQATGRAMLVGRRRTATRVGAQRARSPDRSSSAACLAWCCGIRQCAARVIRLEVSRGGPVWSLWSKRHDAARVERTLIRRGDGSGIAGSAGRFAARGLRGASGSRAVRDRERARAVGGQGITQRARSRAR